MRIMKTAAIVAGTVLATVACQNAALAQGATPVIEVVTLKLTDGVTPAQFDAVDREVQTK